MLRHQALDTFQFDSVVIVSTSLWYEHAIKTMPSTYTGALVNKLLAWWQFEKLYFRENYLNVVSKPSFSEWLSLFLATDLLQQDKILCKYYGIPYKEYVSTLDIRSYCKTLDNVHYLISKNDPMFSQLHLQETMNTLKGSKFSYKIVNFGGHGDFTLKTSNDYLINYCEKVIRKTVVKSYLIASKDD